MTALVVIAKECTPGRVKTRLHPPYTLEAAAEIAAAALAATLETVRRVPEVRQILYLDGSATHIDTRGFEVRRQPSGSLDERLAALFDALDEPTLLIGMDTPQVRVSQLRFAADGDAVLGLADDGGFWAIGMRHPRGDVIRGVPMSRADSGARQLAALRDAGLDVTELDRLRDVDLASDAEAVAALIPGSEFARVVDRAAGSARTARVA